MHFEWSAVAAVVVVGSLLCACGDPIVGETYLGEPVFSVRGDIQQAEVAVHSTPNRPSSDLRLSLLWVGFDSRTLARHAVEQRTDVDHTFARFEMSLFDVPPTEALLFDGGDPTGGDTMGARVGIALIVLYADENGNDALNSEVTRLADGPDIVVGASPRHLLVYATADVAPDSLAGTLLGPLTPGYHLFETDGAAPCQFAASRGCVGSETLTERAPDEAAIVLAVHPSAELVTVPNPDVPEPSISGTSTPPDGNLYAPETRQ